MKPPTPRSPKLASTRKLNAIRPNPTAVSVNESTSGIKFTFTFLSSSSFSLRERGKAGEALCKGSKLVTLLCWTFVVNALGWTKAELYDDRIANNRHNTKDLMVGRSLVAWWMEEIAGVVGVRRVSVVGV